MTRTHRTAAIIGLSATAAVFPQPAFAAPPLPIAHVWIDSWSGSDVMLCAQGDVNDGATTAARWVFTVTGAVPGEGPATIGPFVHIDDGDLFAFCGTFDAGSPPDAAFMATLTFAGVGVGSDVVGAAGLIYEWNSVAGDDDQFQFGSNG